MITIRTWPWFRNENSGHLRIFIAIQKSDNLPWPKTLTIYKTMNWTQILNIENAANLNKVTLYASKHRIRIALFPFYFNVFDMKDQILRIWKWFVFVPNVAMYVVMKLNLTCTMEVNAVHHVDSFFDEPLWK